MAIFRKSAPDQSKNNYELEFWFHYAELITLHIANIRDLWFQRRERERDRIRGVSARKYLENL